MIYHVAVQYPKNTVGETRTNEYGWTWHFVYEGVGFRVQRKFATVDAARAFAMERKGKAYQIYDQDGWVVEQV
jgi:hypothetical protein